MENELEKAIDGIIAEGIRAATRLTPGDRKHIEQLRARTVGAVLAITYSLQPVEEAKDAA